MLTSSLFQKNSSLELYLFKLIIGVAVFTSQGDTLSMTKHDALALNSTQLGKNRVHATLILIYARMPSCLITEIEVIASILISRLCIAKLTPFEY